MTTARSSAPTPTVHQLLREAVQTARRVFPDVPETALWRQAEEMLAWVLGIDRTHLLVQYRERLRPDQVQRWRDVLAAWWREVPVQRITGVWGFWTLEELVVPEGVFIPRPETETLVEAVLEWFPNRQIGYTFCDAGTGCGALALALAHEYPNARVFAVDISGAAVQALRHNAQRYGLQHRVYGVQADWLTAFRRGPLWDAVVTNPPYVTRRAWRRLPVAVRMHEPVHALVPPRGPAHLYRTLARQARARLKPGGILVVEVGDSQAHTVRRWLDHMGGRVVHMRRDLLGVVRCLVWSPTGSGPQG